MYRASRTLLAALLCLGCQGEVGTGSLRVHVQTDLVPGAELTVVRTERFDSFPSPVDVSPQTRRDHWTSDKGELQRPALVASYEDLRAGEYVIRIRLLDARGETVLERLAVADVGFGIHVVTVVMTRDCRGVMCPGEGDSPSLLACLAGRCVDPRCSVETPEYCGPTDCMVSADCPAEMGCAEASCESGVCLRFEAADQCDATEWCSPDGDCEPLPEMDAGPIEADAGPGPLDGGAPDAGAPDAGPVDPGSLGPFAPPAAVAELNSSGLEDDPTLTADMLEIFFEREPLGGATSDLWTARRARLADPFDAPTPVTELNSGARDSTPEISSDGLTLYFSSTRTRTDDLDGLDVYVSSRADRMSQWGAPVAVSELNTSLGDTAPVLSSDGRLGLFASARAARGAGLGIAGLDLFTVSRPDTVSAWGTPTRIGDLSSADADDAPHFIGSPLVVFFCSRRPAADQNLFMASRPDLGSPFGPAVPLDELNSPAQDTDPWLSPDGLTLYYSSDRDGDRGIYVARRASP